MFQPTSNGFEQLRAPGKTSIRIFAPPHRIFAGPGECGRMQSMSPNVASRFLGLLAQRPPLHRNALDERETVLKHCVNLLNVRVAGDLVLGCRRFGIARRRYS